MLNFKTPVIEDALWVTPIAAAADMFDCDSDFSSTFLWHKKYNIKICKFNDFILKCFDVGEGIAYSFPVGSGDPKPAVDALIEDAKERNIPFVISVNAEKKQYLENTYPDMFTFEENRDSADYIYKSEALANLAGKKYQKKRNHISRFLRTYPEYSFETITPDNAKDALTVAKGWCCLHGYCESDTELDPEFCAIRAAFENFDALGLFGGILYIGNEPAAMTVACKLNSRVCDIRFEKALEFDGAYAMINREFAKTLTNFEYINREEDMGLEGLRKAKLSYYPDILLMRYIARAVEK